MNNIETQYKTNEHLNTRISIHAKYSTSKQPFGDWILSHYEIPAGAKVLELGCGTGDMWENHLDLLNNGASLTLTDFSAGMLETAKSKLPKLSNITYQVVDIQDIPREQLLRLLESRVENGILYVPKEYGMFVCK